MTAPYGSMTFSRFFDSVLSEIEFGRVDQGISLLVGLFDALDMQGCPLADAHEELAHHMLHQMLLEEPIYAQAARKPGNYAGLVDTACKAIKDQRIGSTGRRLFEATSNIPIIRALRHRQETAHLKLQRAWKDGQRICLFVKGASTGRMALSGRDQSNVTIIDIGSDDRANLAVTACAPFDLILLADIADSLDTAALFSLIAQMRNVVSSEGTIHLSALRPAHLGSGWRRVCLNWAPTMHDALSLQRAASAAGFLAQIYSDQSDCILWAELRPEDYSTDGGPKNHEP